jgi:PAS domain-containing protein
MEFKRFSLQLGGRFLVAMLAMFGVVWFAIQPGYHGLTVVAGLLFTWSLIVIWRLVNKTNKELTRFLQATRHADFSQRFNYDRLGAGFGELGKTFSDILARQRSMLASRQQEVRYLKALIEHVPVPVMTLHGDATVALQNNAARRLFGSSHVGHLDDFLQFGEGFYKAVSAAVPGNTNWLPFLWKELATN